LKDPWGNPYQYLKIYGLEKKSAGKARKDHFMVPIDTDFDLYSMGPDGASASPLTAKSSRDDIIRANDGGYVGTAEGF
jgi:general secretion pathway protein G